MGMGDAERLVAAVRERAEGTPYVVQPTEDGFDLRIDVGDARWYGLLYKSGLRKVFAFHVDLDEQRHRMTITDDHVDVRWDAGLDTSGHPLPVLTASAEGSRVRGRSYELSLNQTFALAGDARPGTVLDYTFSSAEGRDLIRDAAEDLGWSESTHADQRTGLVIAGIALAAVLVLGVALAVLALAGAL
jgi:hypothetical protein